MSEPPRTADDIVSIVFSFRNEEEVIPAMVERMTAVLRGMGQKFELVFVNDDSTDRSREVLLELKKTVPEIRIVTLSRRFGVSEGVFAGLEAARGAAAIYMDVDLQDPPELCPEMIARWRAGADVVHTVRRSRAGETRTKLALTWLGYKIIRFGSEIDLLTDAGDFKLLSRRAIDNLLRLSECDPYMRGLVTWIGFRQEIVHYERAARAAGTSKFPLWKRGPWKMFAMGLTSHSFLPIYGVFALGLIGIAAMPAVLIAWMLGAIAFEHAALYVMWLSLAVGQGSLGVYVIRTYKDSRRRPRWIVAETID